MREETLIVNFGGPRSLEEVEEFLISLFTDQEVLRTRLPSWLHNWIFTGLAKKRARKVVFDYERIGGKSPIYADTEEIASKVSERIGSHVITFHRYLPQTHAQFVERMRSLPKEKLIRVFPLFAQFSYATTGSIALWFARHLGSEIVERMRWIKSYPEEAGYVAVFETVIRAFIGSLPAKGTLLLFSAHGLPQEFIETGDGYVAECERTFNALAGRFPGFTCKLCYQSQLGKKEWTRPYTSEVCQKLAAEKSYETVVMIPLSFTSDHVETLFEIEEQYLPVLRGGGIRALRCPALNQHPEWIKAIVEMIEKREGLATQALLRKSALRR